MGRHTERGQGNDETRQRRIRRAFLVFIPIRRSGKGTNPEELIGAAEAGCFSMALSVNLEKAGHPAKRISTTATVKLEMVDGGFKITSIDLKTEADVPGIDEAKFREQAELTKKTCPVSVACRHADQSRREIGVAAMFRERTRLAFADFRDDSIDVILRANQRTVSVATPRNQHARRVRYADLFCQLVQIFDKRHRRAIEVLDFRVCGFDDVIFVWRMRAAAVAESEMSGRQLKRFACEDVTGI